MLIGELVGTVWGARQSMGLAGVKLAVIRTPGGHEIVAADPIGANVGERVIVANGSRVRDLVLDKSTPVKSVVIGIVDEVGA